MKPRGLIKALAEDFVVDEIPAYRPCGTGDHLYLHIEKIGHTTDNLVRELSRAVGVEPRDIGVAGMKDRHARTTQYVSLPIAPLGTPAAAEREARLAAFGVPGIRVLSTQRHGNKLRTGHLRGNRFALRVRNIDRAAVESCVTALHALATNGVPNHFGAQRFGRDGDNASFALSCLRGERPWPRDAKRARFMFSSLQSAVFNAVLDARIEDGSWDTPQLGDVLVREPRVDAGEAEESVDGGEAESARGRGALFICTDVAADRPRAARGEVSPTGPMPGSKMRAPEGEVYELERRVAAGVVGTSADEVDTLWQRAGRLGEGTRRALRLWVERLEVESIPSDPTIAVATDMQIHHHLEDGHGGNGTQATTRDLWVRFSLAKGAYATTVLGAVFAVLEPSHPPASAI
jgi:tRNA pseudouridine13 synthase